MRQDAPEIKKYLTETRRRLFTFYLAISVSAVLCPFLPETATPARVPAKPASVNLTGAGFPVSLEQMPEPVLSSEQDPLLMETG